LADNFIGRQHARGTSLRKSIVSSLQAILLLIGNHLPYGSIQLHLVAHFLNEHRLLFELRRQGINLLLLLLHFGMRFEELIQQHRIDRVVSPTVTPACQDLFFENFAPERSSSPFRSPRYLKSCSASGYQTQPLRSEHSLAQKGIGSALGANFRCRPSDDPDWRKPVHKTAIVDPSAQLRGCTVIGRDCRLGAEAILEDTILWPGAEIASKSHLAGCIVRSEKGPADSIENLVIRTN
jgi:hypothetical protein